MRKKLTGVLATLLMMTMLVVGSSTTAFAYADENADTGDAVVVVEENTEGTQTEPETKPEEKDEHTGALTPDGNMTLVDDLNKDEASGLQFMTVTTKDGHYFYIVIDRSGNAENVYFLNTVDEADLMALMSDEEKAQFDKQEEAQPGTSVVPVIDNTDEKTDVDNQKEPETENVTKPKADFSSSLTILGVFGVIGGLIAAAYYFLKVKPGKGQVTSDEDREFYDDDEYENEDLEDVFEEDDEE